MNGQKETPYGKAILTKYPEQVVIAVAKDARGVPNPITLGWAMVTSHEPPMLAVSVGVTRYSHEVIREAGAFVVSFPSAEMARETLFFGTRSGRDTEKIKEAGSAVLPCEKIDCVIFRDAVANFECVLKGELRTGDHTIFAGEVVHAWTAAEKKERLYTIGAGYAMGSVSSRLVLKYTPDLF